MVHWLVNALVASMIFFPTRDYGAHPSDVGLQAEDTWIKTQDGVKIHGWFFQAEAPKASMLFLHGNGTNISGVLGYAKEWHKRGIAVLLLDYRSYGQSEGTIKRGTDIFLDAAAGIDWLKREKGLAKSDIILYGQSIGAAPAVELATQHAYKAVILEAPFSSLKEMGKVHYGFVPGFLLKDFPFENDEKIGNLKCPLFILHGSIDEISPVRMGRRLFELAPEPKQMLETPGAGHNNQSIVGGSDFFDRPFRFIFEKGDRS